MSKADPIYRKVEVAMWADTKFRALSPLPPSGQSLWIYLLTGPHTDAIPGVFVAGKARLAEDLGWSDPEFESAMTEVIDAGMAEFDPRTRLWHLPNALKRNMPANPNVVLSWRRPWSMLPACDLLGRVVESIEVALQERDESFLKAFHEVIGNADPKPSRKALSNQKQEQEQKQKQEQEQKQYQDEKALNTGSLSATEYSVKVLSEFGVDRDDADGLNEIRALKGIHPIGRGEVDRWRRGSAEAGAPSDDAALRDAIGYSIAAGRGVLHPVPIERSPQVVPVPCDADLERRRAEASCDVGGFLAGVFTDAQPTLEVCDTGAPKALPPPEQSAAAPRLSADDLVAKGLARELAVRIVNTKGQMPVEVWDHLLAQRAIMVERGDKRDLDSMIRGALDLGRSLTSFRAEMLLQTPACVSLTDVLMPVARTQSKEPA